MIQRRNTVLYLEGGASAGENACDFTARLRNPIVIDSETEVALNSIVLDYPTESTVQTGSNDELGFTLINGGLDFTATVRAGTYTGAGLASEVQRALNLADPDSSLNYNKTGSWRADYDASSSNAIFYEIKYQLSTRAQPDEPDIVETGGTYNDGAFQADVAGVSGNCLIIRPLATHISYAIATVATDRNFSWWIVADKTSGATPVVSVAFNKVTNEFTVTTRGVAGDPIAVGGALPASTIVMAAKHGNNLVFGWRDFATTQLSDFTELARVPLLDSDGPADSGNLNTPTLYAAFETTEAQATYTKIAYTSDPFATALNLDVNGTLYEVDASELAKNDVATHARLYGGEATSVAAYPPKPLSTRYITLDFSGAESIAPLLGFEEGELITRGATAAVPVTWNSTTVPQASIDSSGLQTSLYVTSSALNVGSRYSSSAAVGTPFILGSAPIVAMYGHQSHCEFVVNEAFYQHVAVAGRQALTTVDLQVRDSRMVIVALPNSTATQSRSRIEIRVKNHPVS